MLEGRELEQTYKIQERNGRLASRMYLSAAYDYKNAIGLPNAKKRASSYYARADGMEFDSLDDVRD